MARAHEVTLELVRPGPPHNQLLSPLTPYMALCGDGSPITFHIDYEHRQLLNRLERLRYVTPGGERGYVQVPEGLRQAQVRELGEEMGKVLARIPSLNAELSKARSGSCLAGDGSEFVQVRLVLSGSELSILPFELARAPQSFPGEGLDLSLQGNLPVVVTREIRRSRPLPASWDGRKPKLLFISAEPGGLSVPMSEHIRALRDAFDPWIEWPEDAAADSAKQMEAVKKHLRVLPNASIEDVYDMCAREAFTHVHILAHGDHFEEAGEQRFGLALCRKNEPTKKHVVDGEQLAKALRAENESGASRSDPLVVTLATCDSGQQGSVLVPGGSLAHDLHTAGIPWVFASQFPLTKTGSIRIAQFLYPRLLRGDDPRLVLYELRRRISMTASREHDWASLVTYASVEPGLEQQVAQFFQDQTVAAIEVLMARADREAAKVRKSDPTPEAKSAIENALDEVTALLERWELRIPPPGGSMEDRTTRTNCFGMQGSTLKRMGLFHAAIGEKKLAQSKLKEALYAYRRAMNEWVTEGSRFNWTASQYLSLSAVLDAGRDRGVYAICQRLAERDLDSEDRGLQAWAHGTLAELELLGSFHDAKSDKMTSVEKAGLQKSIVEHCEKIVSLKGADSFHATSTRRQFERYAEKWKLDDWERQEWTDIAAAAVVALSPKSDPV